MSNKIEDTFKQIATDKIDKTLYKKYCAYKSATEDLVRKVLFESIISDVISMKIKTTHKTYKDTYKLLMYDKYIIEEKITIKLCKKLEKNIASFIKKEMNIDYYELLQKTHKLEKGYKKWFVLSIKLYIKQTLIKELFFEYNEKNN